MKFKINGIPSLSLYSGIDWRKSVPQNCSSRELINDFIKIENAALKYC